MSRKLERESMKKTTKDEYFQSVYKVVEYIEKNYADELSLETLSRLSGFSKYHFHRIFSAIVGENLNAFIRRIRLSQSTGKLANKLSVTEVAMQSGYETASSFAKAFKERFGLSPKNFSKKIKENKGGVMLDAKIIDFDSVDVLYVRRMGDYLVSSGEAFAVLMEFASQQENFFNEKTQLYGIGHDDAVTIPAKQLRYDACITYDNKAIQAKGEVGAKTIEGGKYLYYLHVGAYEELKEIYAQLWTYVIEHDLTFDDKPPFEAYLNDPKETKPEDIKTAIYIPIQ